MNLFAFAAVVALTLGGRSSAAIAPAEAARLAAAAHVVDDIHSNIPQQYWDRARCVAVIPELKKAAFIVGGEYGKGVMSCRSGDRWSAPVFLQLAKGSWGFQAGAEQVDVVMLVTNESGVQKLLQNKVNLGADASIAAGPVGRQGHIGTDAQLTAEILAYSRAQGLFAGIDISGGVLRPDDDANKSAYGAGASPRTILATRDISAPTEAHAFLTALNSVSVNAAPATAPASAATGAARRAESPTADAANARDEDLRARVIELQQTIDRLMSSSASTSSVGTTGGKDTGDTVVVDRAALMRLRQQIEALAAAIERRR